jgi:FkbM family methyltransferase
MDLRMDLSRTTLDARLPDGNMIHFRPFAEGDAEMIKDVYLHKHYDFLDSKAGEVVFDVGAHIGSFALKAARLVGEEGLVVALEPELENYKILEENIKLNGLENIVPLSTALSDFRGRGRLFLAAGTVAHSLIFPKSNEWQEVEVNTMDGLIEKLNLEPDAVKIDAEGAALNILARAENMSCRKIVVAAYHFPMEEVQVSMLLRKLGFKTEIKQVRASIELISKQTLEPWPRNFEF